MHTVPTILCALALAAAVPLRAQTPATKTIRIASGLASPVAVVAAPGDDERLYIVEKIGRVRVWKHGALVAAPVIDLQNSVLPFGDAGLLGLAFDPNFASSRWFFVFYVDTSNRIVVERFETQLGNPELVQPGSGSVILGPLSGQPQLFGQYGGALHFGPDGMLYVAVGDRTIDANGQLLTNDFGKLLRMASDGTIPPSNPFAASAIWALGLRVPWRFSFDRASGDIFIADVGNASWEEIDRLPAGVSGANFGWPTTEGPFNAANHPNFTPPFRAIAHPSTPAGFALIGGFVYRGCAIPSRVGRYFFTEFYSARLSSIAASGSPPGITTESCAPPTGQSLDSPCAFGEDNQGELYICDLDGELYKLVPGDFVDCNGNFVDDRCDVSLGTSHDIDGDGVPDECQACPVAATYGTASASSGGCSAAISFSGSPSASLATPFAIDVTSAEANQHGMVLYGIHGPQSVPWHGGAILCIHPPLQRTPLQDAGGTSGQCDGHFTLDWNAFLSSHPTALGFPWHAGQALWAQAAMRDPSSPSSIATSNALAISVCP